jgi:PleD family two-component response regulator
MDIMIIDADRAMYDAKEAGRNKVVMYRDNSREESPR